ncbi:MAG TPA: tRNA pseudouridine(54/55) synthase Pus10 [Thermoplasmata archaeon]|nr:tRNA pseudouridine(54/55) synthase Pus10 [Thermoplasmata archaeon]
MPGPPGEPSATGSTFPVVPEILDAGRKALALELGPECLGRLFGRHGHGLTNPERAERIAGAIGQSLRGLSEAECTLCRGLFDRWSTWVPRVERAAASLEWSSFSCGSRWDPEILAHEELLWTEVGSMWGESARSAFNRELGKRVEAATGRAGGSGPADLLFVADLPAGTVEVTIRPLYVRGRYVKLDRTLPQTRWPCRACRGRGCVRCSGTGKMYATSVEELIAAPLLAAAGASGSRFHGMGREDIDARMLGSGRPFVLEALAPHHRSVDLGEVVAALARDAAGRVEVRGLAFAEAADVVRVKEARPPKSYRVVVAGGAPAEKVKDALQVAAGQTIAQRTPMRVVHRRSDRVRPRRIVAATLVDAGAGRFTIELKAEAGTYIKEWVEGDGGRTEPSLAGAVGVPLHVESLDVIAVHDEEA